MLLRFRQDVIDLHPNLVVILAGTNDVAGNTGPATNEMIAGNIASMVQLAKANGIKVVLASVLPASGFYWRLLFCDGQLRFRPETRIFRRWRTP
jgi:lysophospholipase L1-like esterase